MTFEKATPSLHASRSAFTRFALLACLFYCNAELHLREHADELVTAEADGMRISHRGA